MSWYRWAVATALTVMLAACGVTQADDVSTTSTTADPLSVLDWNRDLLTSAGDNSASEPALAAANGLALAVWPNGGPTDYTYLYWTLSTMRTSIGYLGGWSPVKMFPSATSTARPTLAAFNGYFYLFYASGIDQYMARFNPQTRVWTGSTLLPFTSLGAVAATAYNGSLAIVRADPQNDRLSMRTMSTTEVFSAEQPIVYSTLAGDPCHPLVVAPGATRASAVPTGDAQFIGFNSNELATSTPALAAVGSCLYIAHRNGASNTLVYNTFLGGSWGPLRSVSNGPGGAAQTSSAQPAIANYRGGLQLVHVGASSPFGDLFWTTLDGASWSAQLGIPEHTSQGTPALASVSDWLAMLHQGATLIDDNGATNVWISGYRPTL